MQIPVCLILNTHFLANWTVTEILKWVVTSCCVCVLLGQLQKNDYRPVIIDSLEVVLAVGKSYFQPNRQEEGWGRGEIINKTWKEQRISNN